jgi:hypothetical protein
VPGSGHSFVSRPAAPRRPPAREHAVFVSSSNNFPSSNSGLAWPPTFRSKINIRIVYLTFPYWLSSCSVVCLYCLLHRCHTADKITGHVKRRSARELPEPRAGNKTGNGTDFTKGLLVGSDEDVRLSVRAKGGYNQTRWLVSAFRRYVQQEISVRVDTAARVLPRAEFLQLVTVTQVLSTPKSYKARNVLPAEASL